ncbi:MAG: tRNA preQ1(34) S-adenosylmethionine ribosyltransferase-isomerase QueA [Verrucomicrobiales bacterium]
MKTRDFDYPLPEELIASRPPERRDGSRMMVVDRAAGTIEHQEFTALPGCLGGDDLLVFNDTKVLRARFFSDDGRIELLRTELLGRLRWKCLVKPGRRMRPGQRVVVGGVEGEVERICADGERIIRFEAAIDDEQFGHLALPHYLGREDDVADTARYQTVYAREPGAIAAPTAGLHFTPEILAGLPHVFVTLHVGVGTFQPVRAEVVEEHVMHSEHFSVDEEAAARIAGTRAGVGRLIAVGTTSARVLEHGALSGDGRIEAGAGETDIFIVPGHEFGAVDALLTNFHLPKSTLFMLVCALGGTELMREAYRQAVQQRYRFFSYGDCMLIV